MPSAEDESKCSFWLCKLRPHTASVWPSSELLRTLGSVPKINKGIICAIQEEKIAYSGGVVDLKGIESLTIRVVRIDIGPGDIPAL